MKLPQEYKAFRLPGNNASVHKKFFTDFPATEWNLSNYARETGQGENSISNYKNLQTQFKENLDWIFNNKKIPLPVRNYARYLKDAVPSKRKFKSDVAREGAKKIRTSNTVVISGNNNNIGTINNGCVVTDQASNKEKEKDVEEEKQVGEEEVKEVELEEKYLWKDWLKAFNNDYEEEHHPYALPLHNIIRGGKGVSNYPLLDKDIYINYVGTHEVNSHNLPNVVHDYVDSVVLSTDIKAMKKAIEHLPADQVYDDNEDLFDFVKDLFLSAKSIYSNPINFHDGESTFDHVFIYPFLQTVANYVKDNNCKMGFKPGEAALTAMKQQLKAIHQHDDEKSQYKADGLLKLYGIENLEILLLETSGSFANKDKTKLNFDHYKGSFGAISMLKQVADTFCHGGINTFSKFKVFFLHGADTSLHLWSLKYIPEAEIFELWREDSLSIQPTFDKKKVYLPSLVSFFFNLKCLCSESVRIITNLKTEHEAELWNNRYEKKDLPSLSNVVAASILKLTQDEDSVGMAQLGPLYE